MALEDTLKKLPFGTVLADRYRLLELLGRGGFGAVFGAWDHAEGQLVAVKMLSEYDAVNENELDNARRIDHPNLVRSTDNFVETVGDEQRTFLVSERVIGQDLQKTLYGRKVGQSNIGALSKPLSPRAALVVVNLMTRGINALHAGQSEEMAHLDIKPSNVYLSVKGELKVGDYGLLKNIRDPQKGLFTGGTTVGTTWYKGEEQFYSLNVPNHPTAASRRSDIYASGAVFYELMTLEKFASLLAPNAGNLRGDERDEAIRVAHRDTSLMTIEEKVMEKLRGIHGKSKQNDRIFQIAVGMLKSAKVKNVERENVVDYQNGQKVMLTPLAMRISKKDAQHSGAYTEMGEVKVDMQRALDTINPGYGDIEREAGDMSYIHTLESRHIRELLNRVCYRERPIEEFSSLFEK